MSEAGGTSAWRWAGRTAGEQVPTPGAERIADRKRREAEEFLLAGFLFHPPLRDRIQRAVGPEDFVVPALRGIYEAALELNEEDDAFDQRALAARLADDLEAQSALAGLPDDPTLDERIPFQIEYMEHQRRTRRRALEIRRELGGGAAASQSDSDGGAQDGGRSGGTAPREQVG